ncbi:hypothetical protein MLD38_019335 [Melastoma candidum]|uniref:Uncharacterized protein n=1 Tax=Melastoma candidum TaxID=119954 RepID=A0ACB9R075_9MYRT|nr:hypothetical protein MLD38_019335 [Melastoma candidum]
MVSDRLPWHPPPSKPSSISPAVLPSILLMVYAAILLAAIPCSSAVESRIEDASRFQDFYSAHCGREIFSKYPIPNTAPSVNASLSDQLPFYGSFASAAAKADDHGGMHSLEQNWFSFGPKLVYGTNNKDVSKVVGTLWVYVQDLSSDQEGGNYEFSLAGYLSESTGQLCMVGSSSRSTSAGDVVFKVRYPVKLNINSSFIHGALECLGDWDGKGKAFGRVSLLGFSTRMDYEYSLMEKESEKGGSFDESDNGDGDNLSLYEPHSDLFRGWCYTLGYLSPFEMEYSKDCDAVNCNPLGKDALVVPNHIHLSTVQCSDQGKVSLVVSFRNSSRYLGYSFVPGSFLLGEGEWDPKAKRVCSVMCHIFNYTESIADSFFGDCSIKMCVRLPATFSIIIRSAGVGEIWSTKAADDSGYFPKIAFRSSSQTVANWSYKYGVMGGAPDSCDNNTEVPKEKAYPTPSSTDMSFGIVVTNGEGQTAHGEARPLFVGGTRHQSGYFGTVITGNQTWSWSSFRGSISGAIQNMSYSVRFSTPDNYTFSGMRLSDMFAAEGVYNGLTGRLCMIGCRRVVQNNTLFANSSLDCNVAINVQFPPLDRIRGELITGIIRSTRLTSDPLYFETLTLKSNSMYHVQATESIWRMDLEIVLVVVSNTLACVFLVKQIFHVRRKPEVLPFISIVMLTVVMLGHMIPLLLNFEALFFGNRYQQSSIWRNGRWLEVMEVVVRTMTLMAFLLELRLLQLTWSARQGDVNRAALWVSEQIVTSASFLLYAVGAAIAQIMHKSTHAGSYHVLQPVDTVYPIVSYESHPLWEYMKSYSGLILDGFLLPQIFFNLFMDSSEKALSSFFYIGTTFVRLLPHAYDLYRAHSSSWSPEFSYIYASHRMDYYSTAWNIIIPCSGMLLALVVYLQQRFGGRCILSKRLRASAAYEKVPVVGNDDL